MTFDDFGNARYRLSCGVDVLYARVQPVPLASHVCELHPE